ncbi:uncharacterized protein V1516DRAFT_663261 [Lipomyces oligophaga]|uniref:uncharacterized protein n=1 Tax=Lipomyces oligophaga TaxID=45792 RepID=UPI0034CD6FB8
MSKKERLKQKNGSREGVKTAKSTKRQEQSYSYEENLTSFIDLSNIGDSELVVILKGLQKRDPTTREKALDSLSSYITRNLPDLTESLLAVWVQFYTHLAVEYSRRERMLSHKITGDLFSALKRTAEKYLKDVIGYWLGGIYDTDKAVSRSALQSFESVFSTDAKRVQVLDVLHVPILEYIKTSIAARDTHLSSDEKYFTEADIQQKVFRQITSGIYLYSYLLDNISPSRISTYQYDYAEILLSDSFWKSCTCSDSSLTRACFNLILQLAYDYSGWLRPLQPYLSQYLLANCLMGLKAGPSLVSFLDCVIVITRLYPDVWNPQSGSNEPSLSLLLSFISEGSHYAGREYWSKVEILIENLPRSVLDVNDTEKFNLNSISASFMDGLKADKFCADYILESYFSLLTYFISASEMIKIQEDAVSDAILLVNQGFVKSPTPPIIFSQKNSRTVFSFLRSIIPENELLAAKFWNEIVSNLSHHLEIGQQENTGELLLLEFFTSTAMKVATLPAESLSAIGFDFAICKLICSAVRIIQKSIGEYNFAAVTLSRFVSSFWKEIELDRPTLEILQGFVDIDIPLLLVSRSADILCDIWVTYYKCFGEKQKLQGSWNVIIDACLSASSVHEIDRLGFMFISRSAVFRDSLPSSVTLESYLMSRCHSLHFKQPEGATKDSSWQLVEECLKASPSVISVEVAIQVLDTLVDASLGNPKKEGILFTVFQGISEKNFPLLAEYIKSENGGRVTARLWEVTGEDANNVDSAKTIRRILESHLVFSETEANNGHSLFETLANAIFQDLEHNSEVTCESLVARSASLLGSSKREFKVRLASQLLLISNGILQRELDMALSGVNFPSIALLNNIGGAYFLISEDSLHVQKRRPGEPIMNFPRIFRFGLYVLEFLESEPLLQSVPYLDQLLLCKYLLQISELAKDIINLYGNEKLPLLFFSEEAMDMTGADDLLSISEKCSALMETKYEGLSLADIEVNSFQYTANFVGATINGESGAHFISDFIKVLNEDIKQRSVSGFYSARILQSLIAHLTEGAEVSFKDVDQFFEEHELRRSPNVLAVAAIFEGVVTYSSTMKAADRIRNELASDILGIKQDSLNFEGLVKIVLLNSLILNDDEDEEYTPLPQHRTIMLLKKLLQALKAERNRLSLAFRSQAFKLLLGLLPLVRDLYGEHWELSLSCVLEALRDCIHFQDDFTPLLYYSLRVIGYLDGIQETNEDVADAFEAESSSLSALWEEVLVNILDNEGTSANVFDGEAGSHRTQAMLMCDSVVARLISYSSAFAVTDLSVLFQFIPFRSEPLQKANLKICRREIPASLESLAVEAALDTKGAFAAELPPEILSLVMNLPGVANDELDIDETLACGMTTSMRSYIYSWVLIFVYLENAPFALKMKYIVSLKDGDYVDLLLNFAASLLSLTAGKPPDCSKYSFETFEVDSTFEQPADEVISSLLYLFYKSLQQIPSMVRKWWSETRNRHLSITVQSYVEKYFSRLLIDNELDSVQSRLAAEADGEEENIQLKVSRPAREVTAVYTIDEQTMEMIVRIPTSFPLHDVVVDGIKRVGVKENQWRAWLLASQALIASQNGTIVDALTLFKRNVNLHFEGVTECAICYSILHQDRSLPNKRCQTCRNKFHAGCLFRWFQSANASTCPLCRQPFSFGR